MMSTFLQKERRVLINVEKKKNVELTHAQVFWDRLYVLCK